MKQGGDSWFFITVDYAFGIALEQSASDFVKGFADQAGGTEESDSHGRGNFTCCAEAENP